MTKEQLLTAQNIQIKIDALKESQRYLNNGVQLAVMINIGGSLEVKDSWLPDGVTKELIHESAKAKIDRQIESLEAELLAL